MCRFTQMYSCSTSFEATAHTLMWSTQWLTVAGFILKVNHCLMLWFLKNDNIYLSIQYKNANKRFGAHLSSEDESWSILFVSILRPLLCFIVNRSAFKENVVIHLPSIHSVLFLIWWWRARRRIKAPANMITSWFNRKYKLHSYMECLRICVWLIIPGSCCMP